MLFLQILQQTEHLQGPNLLANKELAEATGLSVIVSGGISSLEDLARSSKTCERDIQLLVLLQEKHYIIIDLR